MAFITGNKFDLEVKGQFKIKWQGFVVYDKCRCYTINTLEYVAQVKAFVKERQTDRGMSF